MTKRSQYWNTMVDILDGQFPKGECKERGRALVMISYIEMMLNGTKFDENGEPIIKKPIDILEPRISIEGVLYDIKAGVMSVDEGADEIMRYVNEKEKR